MHSFHSQAYELLTGKTRAQRNAQKVKSAIELVDDTLGIDIVEAAGKVVKNGVVCSVVGGVGKIGKSLFGGKKNQ